MGDVEVVGVVFPGPVAHGWDRSVTVGAHAAEAAAIHDQGRVVAVSGVRQRDAPATGVLPVLTPGVNRKMPGLTPAQDGRIRGRQAKLTGRTPALRGRMNAPVAAMNDRVNAMIAVATGRIIEVIAGKKDPNAGKTAAIISTVMVAI